MYEVVATRGIVLQKRGVGEADVLVRVLTSHLGLVRAKATGARLQRSKLRYGLEPLSFGRYSFVRGRKEWRLVGVEDVSREPIVHASPAARRRMGQVSSLLLRLLPGQEHAPGLYQTVHEGFGSLARTNEHADALECVLVLRILAQLGYVPQLPSLSPFIGAGEFTPELAAKAAASRRILIKLINDSLQATGL